MERMCRQNQRPGETQKGGGGRAGGAAAAEEEALKVLRVCEEAQKPEVQTVGVKKGQALYQNSSEEKRKGRERKGRKKRQVQ